MTPRQNPNDPPRDEKAEQGVLGCVMLDPVSCIPTATARLAGVFKPFYDLRHQHLFDELKAMHAEGAAIDPITVQSRLRESAPLKSLGGMPYIAGLMSEVPSAANLEYYLDAVCAVARRRRQIEAATMLEKAARAGNAEAIAEAEQILADASDTKPKATLAEFVESRRFNPSVQPPELRAVFSMVGTPIATGGNLQTIAALIKAGKSALINAMIAAPMATAGSDTLGITSANPTELGVVHIDSEQTPRDHWDGVMRAVRRAGREQCPQWLRSSCLTGGKHRQLRDAVWLEAEKAAQDFGGVHSIILDGVADMVADVNDPAECNDFVASLHALAIQYDCPITGVIHFNPGGEKTRGHLGSQLERKAETNLTLAKDGEVTSVWSEKQRRAPILKGQGPRFAWSSEAGMHVSVAPGASAKEKAIIADAKNLRDDVFLNKPAMRHNELENELAKLTGRSTRTARREINKWGQMGIIERSVAGLLVPKG